MTLDQLKVLEKIVETGSFRGAAQALHRAQSAVSHAIKGLEEELGVALFDRSVYRPVLTDAGKAVHQKAKTLIMGATELELMGHQLAAGQEATLSLAVSALFPIARVTRVLRAFSETYPQTQLGLSIEVMAGVERLKRGDADLAITEWPDLWDEELEGVALCTMPMLPCASPTHPLAAAGEPLDSSQLHAYVHVILKSTSYQQHSPSAGIFQGANLWSTTDFLSKRELLVGGLGWGLMPRHLVANDLEAGKLCALDIPEFRGMELKFFLLRRRREAVGPLAKVLWEMIGSAPGLDELE